MNIENDKLLAELEEERDALAAHVFYFKRIYTQRDTWQIDDDEFISFMPHYAEGLPGTSLARRDALKQAQALDLALAAIDKDPAGAREEISGILMFLRRQVEGGV
jgi:hypothetical protein